MPQTILKSLYLVAMEVFELNTVNSLFDKNINQFQKAYDEKYQIWVQHILFSWRWWLGVAVIICCIGIWIWLSKKDCAARLLLVGLFTAVIATFFDSVGKFFGLWHHFFEVIPPYTFLPWDIFMLPTVVILLILFRPELHPFIKAIILGAFTSFIGLPLITRFGFYEPSHWHFLYSFPIQMVIYLLADFVSKRKKFAPIKR